jgi:eukaryotic-like serine/threonine-protein kinase
MGFLDSLLGRLRKSKSKSKRTSAPPDEVPAGRCRVGQGPYRHAAGAPPLPTSLRLPRFAGYEVVATLESDGERYARYLLKPPGPAEPGFAVACFAVDEDRPYFEMSFDEARLATRLQHRNLGRLLDLGRDGDIWWHLCEYSRGETLQGILTQIRYGAAPPSLDVVVAAFADFAEGLHAAHTDTDEEGRELGWCYRELSPAALFLSLEGTGKVIDWGLQGLVRGYRHRGSDSDGVTGTGLLTELQRAGLRHLAPEQVRGRPSDRRADVFALGVMLYELSTGSSLFLADTDLATIELVMKQEAPPPSTLVRGYPPELDAIVLRALTKDPAARATAGEVAAGLRAVLAARGVDDPAALVAGYVRALGAAPLDATALCANVS